MKKRTDVDWKKHELIIKEDSLTKIWELKKPKSRMGWVRFVSTCDCLMVTGDYGNWVFCREFWPSPDGRVSDEYWIEKLTIASTQNPYEFDYEVTEKSLKEAIEECGEEDEGLKEYYESCLGETDWEIGYDYCSYNYPSDCGYECIVKEQKVKIWLQIIFDAFEEICRRLKENVKN